MLGIFMVLVGAMVCDTPSDRPNRDINFWTRTIAVITPSNTV